MALQASGPMSFSQINTEAGFASNAATGLNNSTLRTLAGRTGSGTLISFSHFYGKSMNLTVTGYGDSSYGESDGVTTTTQYTFPRVAVSGGAGGYTYQWSITSGTATLTNGTTATPSVAKTISKFGFTGDIVLQCVVRDAAGTVVTVTNIVCHYEWTSIV